MKMESFARIMIVTLIFTIWLVMALSASRSAWANDDDDDHKPKKSKGTPTVLIQEPDRYKENLWGGVAFGGLAVTALQKTEHPTLYAIGAGALTAAAVEAAQPGGFNGKNFRYAAGGVLLGTTTTSFVFGKKFFGWKTTFK
jgi:hypothetical protein